LKTSQTLAKGRAKALGGTPQPDEMKRYCTATHCQSISRQFDRI
jgi:hypothetical protein